MAQTVSSPLMKRLVAAEDRLKPKDPSESLQRRIDDFATRYQEGDPGDPDDRLSQYPRELFEPKPEPLRETAVDGVSETEGSKDTSGEETSLKSDLRKDYTPLQEFNYSEIKRGWGERLEVMPDGSTIKHTHLDLTQVDPDEPDERDPGPFDWEPPGRGPSLRDVKRSMGIED
ncbi:MAG: hypothetical protein PHN90_10775 [Methanothrix sp.]|nr:hypothetical protein [Methanothrix sp.]